MPLPFLYSWSYKSYGEVKSPRGSSWVAVHVIPVSLPDGIQYFSLEEVLPQHLEQDQVIYKPWIYKE